MLFANSPNDYKFNEEARNINKTISRIKLYSKHQELTETKASRDVLIDITNKTVQIPVGKLVRLKKSSLKQRINLHLDTKVKAISATKIQRAFRRWHQRKRQLYSNCANTVI